MKIGLNDECSINKIFFFTLSDYNYLLIFFKKFYNLLYNLKKKKTNKQTFCISKREPYFFKHSNFLILYCLHTGAVPLE